MRELPPLVRFSLAFGLLVIALICAWGLILHPLFLAARTAVEELDDMRFELHRINILAREGASATPESVQSELLTLQHELFAMEETGDTDARIISAVDQLVRISGLRLLQLKAGGHEQAGSLIRHTIDINVSGREPDLAQLLTALERHRPRLIIDRASFLSQGGAPTTSGFNLAPELSVELRIAGFAADIGTAEMSRNPHAP